MRNTSFASMISVLLAAAALLCRADQALAQERYYLIMFGTQRMPPEPRHSHTFAVFVRVGHFPGCPEAYLESHTVSWLSQTGIIRLRVLLAEPGVNLDLHTTIHWALDTGQRISMWGPYEIEPELYQRAMEQICLLGGGKVRYKAVDSGYPSWTASNCIHAVSTIVDGPRLHVASPSFGETASYYVLKRMRRWIIDRHHREEWLVTALGLDCYPIIHREWQNPRSGVLWTAFRSVFGIPERAAGWRGYPSGVASCPE